MQQYFDLTYIWDAFPKLLPYLSVTLYVSLIAVSCGTAFGILLAFMKLSKHRIWRFIANSYTTIMRCTPSIVLLFLIYYGVPALTDYLFAFSIQNVHTGFYVVITFTLQFAAMMSEVVRASIKAVPEGQFEAAVSVGLSPAKAYIRIVFPQAIVFALPNIGNGIISVLQEGALAYTIGFIDIVGKANLIIANNYGTHTLEIFIALAIIYWILAIGIERAFRFIERKLQFRKELV
ncbi:amino acid ABC transporter permease [Paenibacillus yanchengensis]|uniref:Amino acid ABC transporter permease n=1 Tax=Paenibacillus yanchengensis TaxID=2035833 RepID=A0ABW4YJE9_9BACL